MFFRRKNTDGFDWHKYVRTTIKLRRDQRRAKLEDIGRVAVGQVKAAGDAAVNGVVDVAGTGWRATVSTWRGTIAQPPVALPIALCGGVALLSGLHRWVTIAADEQAMLPLGIGIGLIVLIAPLALARLRFSTPSLPGLSTLRLPANAVPVVTIAALALGLGWFAWGRGMPSLIAGRGPAAPSATNTAGLVTLFEGRGTVLSGEMIRLQGRLLHLSGIEAPDRQQTCVRATKQTWRCGDVALAALERLSRGKSFRCVTQGSPDVLGRTEANCTIDGRDVAGELVKDGHVFSAATYFGGYASLETEARRAGTGVWSGEAERPADFRSKLWAAAKAAAPDGCPIKGRISANRKTYLMPWAAEYQQAKPRTNKGERWFCDEVEAQNAGFKPAGLDKRPSSR